jgi:hypothetical protein
MIVSVWPPGPDRRVAHHHEARDLIDEIVLPLRLEGGVMAAFVPTAIAAGPVENIVNEKAGDSPPRTPEIHTWRAEEDERPKSDYGVAGRRSVAALHQRRARGMSV